MTQSTALQKTDDTNKNIYESLALRGDMSALNPQDKAVYLQKLCESLGLNPLTQPFTPLKLNGKEILYASRGCTDQLASIHRLTREIIKTERLDDVFIVTCKATAPDGRFDISTGVVTIGNLKGDALANALMKAETKAKRRATLSFCGLGFLDETEIETTQPEGMPANPVAKSLSELVTAKQLGMIRALSREIGINPDEECQSVFNCRTDELSIKAASNLIQHLQDLQREQEISETSPAFKQLESPEQLAAVSSLRQQLTELMEKLNWSEDKQAAALAKFEHYSELDKKEDAVQIVRAQWEQKRLEIIKDGLALQNWDEEALDRYLLNFGIENGLDMASGEEIAALYADMKETRMI
jgi:hypothetical protein